MLFPDIGADFGIAICSLLKSNVTGIKRKAISATIPAISVVPKKTTARFITSLLTLCEEGKLARHEDIAKKTRGTTAVISKFRKISPIGFKNTIYSGKYTPSKIPKSIPNTKGILE